MPTDPLPPAAAAPDPVPDPTGTHVPVPAPVGPGSTPSVTFPVPAVPPDAPQGATASLVRESGTAADRVLGRMNTMTGQGMVNAILVLLILIVGLTMRDMSHREDARQGDSLRVASDTNERTLEAINRMWKDRETSEEKTRLILDRVLDAFQAQSRQAAADQDARARQMAEFQAEMRQLRQAIQTLTRRVDARPAGDPAGLAPMPRAKDDQGEAGATSQSTTSTTNPTP